MPTDKEKTEATGTTKKVTEKDRVLSSVGAIASTEDLQGKYCNLAIIQHTEHEYVLDFFLNLNEQNILVSRMLMSPDHALRLYKALGTNLKDYQEKYGEIKKKK